MIPKHYLGIFVFISFVSVSDGNVFENHASPEMSPDVLRYIDERFVSLISDLTSRLEELERKHTEDVRRIDILERLHADGRDQIKNIGREMGDLRAANNDLQMTVNNLQNQLHQQTVDTESGANVAKLTNNTENLTANVNENLVENFSSKERLFGKFPFRLQETGNNSNTAVRDLNSREDKGEASHLRNARSGSTTPTYAFHAILGHALDDLGSGNIIAFKNVVTMIGGHYSTNTGVFTCLQPGVYVFHWSVRVTSTTGYIYTELSRNGNTVGTIISYHASEGSASAVVELSAGDDVWVRVADRHSPGADIEGSTAMFSGFLLN